MLTYEESQQALEYVVNMFLTITDGRIKGAAARGDKTAVINFTRAVDDDILKAYAEKLTERGYTFITKNTIFGKTKFIFKL